MSAFNLPHVTAQQAPDFTNPTWANLVRQSAGVVDGFEGAEVVGEWVGGGDGAGAGLVLDGAVAAGVRTTFPIDQPVRASVYRGTGATPSARQGRADVTATLLRGS
jgi:hypothetical protein